jgi:integrase
MPPKNSESQPELPPLGVSLSSDVQHREGRRNPYTARVRWFDPVSGERRSKAHSAATDDEAALWIEQMQRAAQGGIDPVQASLTLTEYGESVMDVALRGLEGKTLDPYLAGWRKRVTPALGHIPVRLITPGAVDRTVHKWIEQQVGRSSVKNSLAVLSRIMKQAVRDEIIESNPARVTGWQREYARIEDELLDPRSLALPNWQALTELARSLVARSKPRYEGWGDMVVFAACTAARIGEVSGVRAGDIDPNKWTWMVRRQTTPGPGGLIDKGTKGKRARTVPLIPAIRPLVTSRLEAVENDPSARLFTGPRGGRVTTAILRDATHWDEVVNDLGYDHLRRHDLRHTGLTWMADAGVPVHVLQRIAGHSSITITQRYLHPDDSLYQAAGDSLSTHLGGEVWSPGGHQETGDDQEKR